MGNEIRRTTHQQQKKSQHPHRGHHLTTSITITSFTTSLTASFLRYHLLGLLFFHRHVGLFHLSCCTLLPISVWYHFLISLVDCEGVGCRIIIYQVCISQSRYIHGWGIGGKELFSSLFCSATKGDRTEKFWGGQIREFRLGFGGNEF
jgi:hypothetical protein